MACLKLRNWWVVGWGLVFVRLCFVRDAKVRDEERMMATFCAHRRFLNPGSRGSLVQGCSILRHQRMFEHTLIYEIESKLVL